MLNAATAENLKRKAAYADHVQMHEGVPLPSWIDLSLTELCNRSHGHPRACVFCPRIDPAVYPNQALHMGVGLVQKIGDELRGLNYQGVVVLCGFGEPLLHPRIADVVAALKGAGRVEIVTNGDRLSRRLVRDLYAAGADYIAVSLYDGAHQIAPMRALFEGYDDCFILRDRWHSEAEGFGLKLTNRAGVINAGKQAPVETDRPCYYPAYSVAVDWNGDVLLCVQDWNKRLKFGNLHDKALFDIWRAPALHKHRLRLLGGDRRAAPCNGCNASGTEHGNEHRVAWAG